jgi:hypothetical protein
MSQSVSASIRLLAERGTTCGTYTTLERHWDAPGYLLAFEARLAYLPFLCASGRGREGREHRKNE